MSNPKTEQEFIDAQVAGGQKIINAAWADRVYWAEQKSRGLQLSLATEERKNRDLTLALKWAEADK